MKEFVEKLIQELKEESIIVDDDAGHRAVEIIEHLAEEYNNGWIPCEKELPETNESVLCWAKSTARGGDVCFVGSYHKGFWFLQSSANTHSFPGQYKIVAWHQLPEKFKPSAE